MKRLLIFFLPLLFFAGIAPEGIESAGALEKSAVVHSDAHIDDMPVAARRTVEGCVICGDAEHAGSPGAAPILPAPERMVVAGNHRSPSFSPALPGGWNPGRAGPPSADC